MVRYVIRYQIFHLQCSSMLDFCLDQSIQLLFITNGPCCFLLVDICSMSTTNYINLSQLFLVLFATVTRTALSRQEFDIQCFRMSGNDMFAPYFFDVDKFNDSKGVNRLRQAHTQGLCGYIQMQISCRNIRLRLFLLGSIRLRRCKNLVYLLGHCL